MNTQFNSHKGMSALGAVLVTVAMVAGVANLADASNLATERVSQAQPSTDRIEVSATRLIPSQKPLHVAAGRERVRTTQ
jgi:hypothetical protein